MKIKPTGNTLFYNIDFFLGGGIQLRDLKLAKTVHMVVEFTTFILCYGSLC